MRKLIFFIVPVAIILISVCAYSVAASTNLLTNASFKKGDLSGWNFWSDGGVSADVVREDKSDSFCAKVSFKGQRKGSCVVIYQKIKVKPGQTVIFKSDLMSKDISKAVGYVKIVFHKSFEFSSIGNFFASNKLTSPSLWKTFSVEAKAPEGTGYAELGLVLQGSSSEEGSVYFDNCEVEIKK